MVVSSLIEPFVHTLHKISVWKNSTIGTRKLRKHFIIQTIAKADVINLSVNLQKVLIQHIPAIM